MIEDEIYRSSSQFRLWSFTEASLKQLRATTNSVASDRVRAALRRAQDARRSATSSTTGTPAPGSDAENKAAEDKQIECLTPEEEQQVVDYYSEQIIQLGENYKPPLPTIVRVRASLLPHIPVPQISLPILTDPTQPQRPPQSNTSAASTSPTPQ